MYKKLFRNKNYMLLITGNFVSLLGSNIQQFVLSLYVLALTGSATLFASMLAVSILPRILLSPVAGVFGDWFDKKKAIIILDVTNALVLGAFSVLFFLDGGLSIGLIYVLVILLEITEIFFASSMSAVLPSLVKKDELTEANSLRSMIVNIGQLLSPIIGALIYGMAGLLIVLVVNAVSFLLSALSEMFIDVPDIKASTGKKSFKVFKKDLLGGIDLIRGNTSIKTLIIIATIINFAIGPLFSVGMIFTIKEVIQASDLQFGIYQAILSSSMIIAPLFLVKTIKKHHTGKVIAFSFLFIGLLIYAIAFSATGWMRAFGSGSLTSYMAITVFSFIMGVFVTCANISITTMLQKIVPLEYMGRTSTVLGLAVTVFIPVGQMVFGSLYDVLEPSLVIAMSGTIILITVLYFRHAILRIDEQPAAATENEEEPVRADDTSRMRPQAGNEAISEV